MIEAWPRLSANEHVWPVGGRDRGRLVAAPGAMLRPATGGPGSCLPAVVLAKPLSGTQWVRGLAESGAVSHIALFGPTATDVRDVIVEGPSGLLSIAPNSNRPNYEPTKRRLTWPNGVQAAMFSTKNRNGFVVRSMAQRYVMNYADGAMRKTHGTIFNLALDLASGRVRS